METGVVVSSSAGNDGPSLGTLHNWIPWLLTVAAGTIDHSFAGTMTLGNGLIIVGWTMFPPSAFVEDVQLVYNRTYSTCNSTKLLSQVPTDAIIICEETGLLEDQIDLVCASNFAGAIFVSDETELFERVGLSCPGAVICSKDAPAVLEYAKLGNRTSASIKFQQTVLGTKPATAVASYTSRGPSPRYSGILKPDVMAPGSLVLAAWFPHDHAAQIGLNILLSGDYNIISGRSMACPHASGVTALLKGAHPEGSAAAISSALMTTSNPLDNTFNCKIKTTAKDAEVMVTIKLWSHHSSWCLERNMRSRVTVSL